MTETLLTQRDIDEAIVVRELQKILRETGFVPKVDTRAKLKALIAKGWRATYAELFGQTFVDSLDSAETDDKHHSEAIEWHWTSRIALLEGRTPDYYAYFPIWGRGNMKSSIAESMVVVDAILSVAYNQPGYCLYIGREKDRVQENIGNLETLFSRKKIREYAPSLSEVARNEETNSKRRWTGTFLHTKAGYIIKGGTVESSQAGSRIKHLESDGDQADRQDTRVTFFVPDDIDSREDSPVIAETRFRLLTTEILPMKQENTLTFFAQNLISRYSVMYRIQTGQANVLTNRKPTQPIPAVRDLKTVQQTVDGIVKDIVVSGRPTWRVWDLKRVQNEIDTMGLDAFNRECNHEVEQSKEGVILYNYDDKVHVISESEFAAVYGSLDVWLYWRKKPGNDWARTKTDKHANVAAWLTVSDSNTALPNHTFLMHPMSFPPNSSPEDVAERLISCLSPYAYEQVTWLKLRKDLLLRLNAATYTKSDADRIAYEFGELARIIPNYTRPLLQRCNVQQGECSHEADGVRKIYSGVYALGFRGTNPKTHGGMDEINRAMRVDYEEPHAFRPDDCGYSRWHMVVPDDLTREAYRVVNGKPVYHPRSYPLAVDTKDMVDSDLCRFHFSNARFQPPKLTAEGEKIDSIEKIHDDFYQMLAMMYFGAPLQGTSLTEQQRVNLLIPNATKEMVAAAVTGDEKLAATLVYEFEESFARQALNPDYSDDIGDISEWE